jgi:hypothetical protein
VARDKVKAKVRAKIKVKVREVEAEVEVWDHHPKDPSSQKPRPPSTRNGRNLRKIGMGLFEGKAGEENNR